VGNLQISAVLKVFTQCWRKFSGHIYTYIYIFIYLYSTTATNEASEENTMVLLKKSCEVSSVPDEANCDSSRKQGVYPQPGQKVMYVDLRYCLQKLYLQ